MKLALIPPGTFRMGNLPEEKVNNGDAPQHSVTISRGFYMGTTPVTQKQWLQIMDRNHSRHQGDELPVANVSWYDCQEFCRRLSQRESKHYRLPTETEWEYACRAGTTSPYYGNDPRQLAWFLANSANQPHPVGQLQPNTWGLCDTLGNIWEWCEDWYGPYPEGPVRDPKGPDTGDRRIMRGGSWASHGLAIRASWRRGFNPNHSHDFGFRVVLSAQP